MHSSSTNGLNISTIEDSMVHNATLDVSIVSTRSHEGEFILQDGR